jgi:hypothetical protein
MGGARLLSLVTKYGEIRDKRPGYENNADQYDWPRIKIYPRIVALVLLHTAPINPADFITVFVAEVDKIPTLVSKRLSAVVALGHTTATVLHTGSSKDSGWRGI